MVGFMLNEFKFWGFCKKFWCNGFIFSVLMGGLFGLGGLRVGIL